MIDCLISKRSVVSSLVVLFFLMSENGAVGSEPLEGEIIDSGLPESTKLGLARKIREMARQENVGVLLTSHDAGDLEALCRRVIVINHGQIVYEDKVSNLKRKFLTSKLVEVRYGEEVPKTFSVDGTEVLKTGQYGVKLRFDTRTTPVEKVLSHLTVAGSVVDITIADPPLEEVIAKIYQTQDIMASAAKQSPV